jgi:hypothetical protein
MEGHVASIFLLKYKLSEQAARKANWALLCLHGFPFDLEVEGTMFLHNAGK